MKKVFKFIGVLAFITITCFSVAGCKNDLTDEKEGNDIIIEQTPSFNTIRYDPVPANERGEPEIIMAVTNGENNLYILYLGYVMTAPVATGSAFWWDGINSWTISLSENEITEESIETSVAYCVSESVEQKSSISASLKASASFRVGGLLNKASGSVSSELNSSLENRTRRETSTTNTYTTAVTKAKERGQAYAVTIGSGNPVGKYRIAMFGTADVYVTVELNKNNTEIINTEYVVCARPATYTYLVDYDPNLNGEFTKTANSNKFNISINDFKNLPLNILKFIENDPPMLIPQRMIEKLNYYCIYDNKGYSKNYSYTSTVVEAKEVGSDPLDIIIDGCTFDNNLQKYTIHGNNTNLGLNIKMGYDSGPNKWPANLGVAGSTIKTASLSSDTWQDYVDNTSINLQTLKNTIGKGAYDVVIKYTDGESDNHVKFNFLDGKMPGNMINLLDSIAIKDKPISQISLVVVYEVTHTLSNGGFCTNWRAEQTIKFTENKY